MEDNKDCKYELHHKPDAYFGPKSPDCVIYTIVKSRCACVCRTGGDRHVEDSLKSSFTCRRGFPGVVQYIFYFEVKTRLNVRTDLVSILIILIFFVQYIRHLLSASGKLWTSPLF